MFAVQSVISYILIDRARRRAMEMGDPGEVGGFPQDIFLDMSEEEYLNLRCNICLNVVKQAYICSNRHLFCKTCIDVWRHTGNESGCANCPVCRVEGEYEADPTTDTFLRWKKIRCPVQDCSWTGHLQFICTHRHQAARSRRNSSPGNGDCFLRSRSPRRVTRSSAVASSAPDTPSTSRPGPGARHQQEEDMDWCSTDRQLALTGPMHSTWGSSGRGLRRRAGTSPVRPQPQRTQTLTFSLVWSFEERMRARARVAEARQRQHLEPECNEERSLVPVDLHRMLMIPPDLAIFVMLLFAMLKSRPARRETEPENALDDVVD